VYRLPHSRSTLRSDIPEGAGNSRCGMLPSTVSYSGEGQGMRIAVVDMPIRQDALKAEQRRRTANNEQMMTDFECRGLGLGGETTLVHPR
jgi:hypothetical protein